jgi:hypothetical protein
MTGCQESFEGPVEKLMALHFLLWFFTHYDLEWWVTFPNSQAGKKTKGEFEEKKKTTGMQKSNETWTKFCSCQIKSTIKNKNKNFEVKTAGTYKSPNETIIRVESEIKENETQKA